LLANVIEVAQNPVVHDHRGPTHRTHGQPEFLDQIPERIVIEMGIAIEFRRTSFITNGKRIELRCLDFTSKAATGFVKNNIQRATG
jgi:hypothetical protein